MDAHSSRYSEWNVDERWSSQEWKFDELKEVRTGRPVYEQPPGLFIEHDDMDSDTVADSDMSLLSRSFLHRVNDRVRKIQDQSSKDATDIGSICIHGEELPGNLHSMKNTGKDLTMKQMFDICEKLIAEQSDEICGVNTINWCDYEWKHLSLIGDEEVVSLSRAKVYVFFRFCVMPWKDEREPTIKYCLGGQVEVV